MASTVCPPIDHALGRARQLSETRRLFLLFALLAVALGIGWVRHLKGEAAMQGRLFGWMLLIVVLLTLYALGLLWLVRRADRRGQLLPGWVWVLSVIVEALAPTAGLAVLQELSPVGPLSALTAPAILMYGVIIVASVLRLRPWLSLLSGFVCAAGHTALLCRALIIRPESLIPGEFLYYLSYPVMLAFTGAAAAWVSVEVRKYLVASLREAEARQRLRLVEKELDIARNIQQGLMPKAKPDLPGFEIAGWNRPASETGGDYYDWQQLGDGRLAVIIADVTGHGLGPAMLMAVCRAYARACVLAEPELGSALERANALLTADLGNGQFVTLAAAVVDPASGQVELLSAGHGPILLFHAQTGQVSEFDGNGLPLGLVVDECYGYPHRLQMAPGDVLLLVTDGFVEWAKPADGELFGTGRLRGFLENHAHLNAETLIRQLTSAVEAFGPGAVQADDMTAVVIRRN